MSTPRSAQQTISLTRLDQLARGDHLAGWIRAGALVTLASYLFVLGVGLLAGTKESTSVVSELGVIVATLLALALLRFGRPGLAAFSVLAAVWTELMASLLKDGGFHAQATVVLPVLVIGTGLLLGARWAWVTAISTAAVSAALVYVGNVVLGLGPLPVENLRHAVVVTASLLATAALVHVALRSFGRVVEAARLGELRASRLVDEAPDGIVMLDPQLRILTMNPMAESLLQGSQDEYRGRTLAELLAPRGADRLEQVLRGILDDPDSTGPLRVASAVDERRVFEVTARRRPDAMEGEPRCTIQLMLRDVSRQVALEDRAARLGRILEEVGNEVIVFDRDTGALMLLSRGARRNLGLPPGGMPANIEEIDPSLGGEGRARLSAEVEGLGGTPYRVKGAHRRPDGEMYPIEVEYLGARLDDREVIVAFAVDVTDRERARVQREALQSQLEHAQRMEAIGHLAGGVAHDFNNLLTVIGVCGGELRDVVPPEAAHLVDDLLEAQSAGSQLTRQLLTFARKDVPQPEALAFGGAVMDSMSLVRRLVGPAIEVEVRVDACARVRADRGQIEQILINLVANACDAIRGSGTITLRVDEVERDGSPWARLRVSDTGVGMSRETQARIFEPFFTTKDVGRGTGLGLSTVHGIVVQNGGRISVRSRRARGTTFEILWPACETSTVAATPSNASAESEDPLRRPGCILLVEDNEAAAGLFHRVLERDGHRVIRAADGREGLDAARARISEIDLVLTDVVMPRMSGPDMVRELRAIGCEAPVLFVSGYVHGELEGMRRASNSELLPKPFGVAELRATVWRMLAGPTGSGTPGHSGAASRKAD